MLCEGAPVGGDVAIGVVIATSVTGVGCIVVWVTDEHTRKCQTHKHSISNEKY